jgi:hypothetical protein
LHRAGILGVWYLFHSRCKVTRVQLIAGKRLTYHQPDETKTLSTLGKREGSMVKKGKPITKAAGGRIVTGSRIATDSKPSTPKPSTTPKAGSAKPRERK